VVRHLLDRGALIGLQGPNAETALHIAARSGNQAVLQLLIDRGVNNLEQQNDDLQTPLHVAVAEGNYSAVRFLLEKGAKVLARANDPPNMDLTPLHFAALYGHRKVAELLLRKGAALDEKGGSDVTPLHCAASRRRPDVADLLLERGADVEAVTNKGWRPLQLGAGNKEVMKVLLKHGADVNAKSDGHTALYYATLIAGHVTVLLEAGADTNDLPRRRAGYWISQPSFNSTLAEIGAWKERNDIFKAAEGGNLSAVQKLLSNASVDIKAKDAGGGTALHRAVQHSGFPYDGYGGYSTPKSDYIGRGKFAEVVELLLQQGADIEMRDAKERTPLILAMRRFLDWGRNGDVVEILLKKNADIEAIDSGGKTPLQAVVDGWAQAKDYKRKGYTIAAELLLKYGADSTKVDAKLLKTILEAKEMADKKESSQEEENW